MLQLQSYSSIMQETYGFPVKRLLLAYMDDVTPPLSLEVEQKDLTGWLTERTLELDRALKEDNAPSTDTGNLCHYCAFKKDCTANDTQQ